MKGPHIYDNMHAEWEAPVAELEFGHIEIDVGTSDADHTVQLVTMTAEGIALLARFSFNPMRVEVRKVSTETGDQILPEVGWEGTDITVS